MLQALSGKPGRRLALLALLAIGVAAATLAASRYVTFLVVAENWLVDLRMAAVGARHLPDDQVVVVAITEDTLAGLSRRSPVDRRFLAGLLETARKKGARAIGLDLLLDQPTSPDEDQALAMALRAPGAPVVVGVASVREGLSADQQAFQDRYLAGIPSGSAAITIDTVDGIARRAPADGLAAALARLAGKPPLNPGEPVSWRGPPNADPPTFRVYPAERLTDIPKLWLAGRIVLVGADLPSLDRYPTPFRTMLGSADGALPGVIIHAHLLSQILDGRRIFPAGWAIGSILTLLFSACGVAIAATPWRASSKAALVALGAGLALLLGFALFRWADILVPIVAPSIAMAASAGIASAWLFRDESRRRRFIEGAFRYFLAPAYVERLIADPGLLRVGGERRELTFLFTDVTGFTTLSERTSPDALVAMLNLYFDGLCAIVLDHGGTIDKMVGDGIHAFFGAPVPQPDHAARAVRCAVAIAAFGDAFAQQQQELGHGFGATRVGVNTGPAIIGNFGGPDRWDYTAHGDAVNTAARLESANGTFGTLACVSQATAALCPEARFRPIGRVLLKGKAAEIEVLEPLAIDGDPEASAEYHAAYDLMSAGDPRAEAAFAALLARHPGDSLAAFHLARCSAGQLSCQIVLMGK
jgi:adenylate cyclase